MLRKENVLQTINLTHLLTHLPVLSAINSNPLRKLLNEGVTVIRSTLSYRHFHINGYQKRRLISDR